MYAEFYVYRKWPNFSKELYSFAFQPAMWESFSYFIFSLAQSFKIFCRLSGCVCYLFVVINLHFPDDWQCSASVPVIIFAVHISSLMKFLFKCCPWKKIELSEVPLWHSRLRMQHCCSRGTGHSYGTGSIPGWGTSTCHACGQKKIELSYHWDRRTMDEALYLCSVDEFSSSICLVFLSSEQYTLKIRSF